MSPKFNAETDIGDLSGKVILVTGGNAGIGAATIRALAQHNPEMIYLCARRVTAGEETAKAIVAQYPKAKIEVLELDLASLDSVKKCAAVVNEKARLDLVFLNAGISATLPGLTKEGYELTLGTNHVGHAFFTQLIMPKILQTKQQDPTADVRIMVTASIAAYRFAPKTGLILKEAHDAKCLHAMGRYGQSKLANVLFARKLAQLYPSITSTSSHPGTVRSDIWGKATDVPKIVLLLAKPVLYLAGVTNEEGALTQLWTATAKAGVENGVYYEPVGKDARSAGKLLTDQKLTDELWDWTTEELAKHGGNGWPAPSV